TRYASLSLKDVVCLCAASGDEEAWEEFVFRVGKSISLTIMRTASRWGRAFSGACRRLGPGDLSQTLGRWLSSPAGLRDSAPGIDFGIPEENRGQCHSRPLQASSKSVIRRWRDPPVHQRF